MRASVLVGCHNEGDRLWRTVESILGTIGKLDAEVVVSDDGSTDGSIAELRRHFPHVVVVSQNERVGVAAARCLAAGRARGDVLVFLDGHTRPEEEALERLVVSVEKTKGEALVTPRIVSLDETTWRSQTQQSSHGYALNLETFDSWWLPLKKMKEVKEGGGTFYESPGLVGCAVAVSRQMYDRLWGFDQHMRQWGNEDLDFALKAWTMGARVLHDPEATVAHRFQRKFADYEVSPEYPLANKIRAARKHFTESVWEDWLARAQERNGRKLKNHPEGLWASAWGIFKEDQKSAEQERRHLLSHRLHDEFWYAKRFDLAWPALGGTQLLAQPAISKKLFGARVSATMAPPDPPYPASATWVSDYTNEAAGNSYCANVGAPTYTGWQRKVSMQVLDQYGHPYLGVVALTESFVAVSNNLSSGVPAAAPTFNTGDTGLYDDTFFVCAAACNSGSTNTNVITQKHTAVVGGNSYTLANITLVYACTYITIDGA